MLACLFKFISNVEKAWEIFMPKKCVVRLILPVQQGKAQNLPNSQNGWNYPHIIIHPAIGVNLPNGLRAGSSPYWTFFRDS